MEFWTAVAVIRRRWYVFVPTLMVFALLAAFLVGQVKPTYKASGTIGLLQVNADPNDSTASTSTTVKTAEEQVKEASNPYAAMDRIQFANVMASFAIDPSFKDRLVAAGGSPDYTVVPPFGNTPLITLSSSAPTEQAALDSYRILVTQFQQEVIDQQRLVNASESSLFRGVPGPQPKMAFAQNGARTKGVIVVAALGFLVAVGLSFLVDSAMAARARRREQEERDERAGELVTLIPAPCSPLDDLADLDLDDPDPKAGGSGGSMRW